MSGLFRRALPFLLVVAASGCVVAPVVDCSDDIPCADGLVCIEHICAACVEGRDDVLCGEGKLCVGGSCLVGDCRASTDCTTAPNILCKDHVCSPCVDGDDAICGAGKLCVEGACVPGDCRQDSECVAGLRCKNLHCSPECGTDAECTDPTKPFCRNERCAACRDGVDDALCGPGAACVDGACVQGGCHLDTDCKSAPDLFCKANRCSPCTDVVDDGRCGAGKMCLGGTCRVGDCRSDDACSRGRICLENVCADECALDEDCTDTVRRFCRAERCLPCRDGIDDALCGPGSVCLGGICTLGGCHDSTDCHTFPKNFCKANHCEACTDGVDDVLCGAGRLCLSGVCTTAECRADLDCPLGQVCRGTRCSPECQIDVDCTDPVKRFCRSERCVPCRDGVDDALCGPGKICFSGRCIEGTCHVNADCPNDPDRFCHDGRCERCTDVEDDSECGDGNLCVGGSCRAGDCHTAADCTGGDVCRGSICQQCLDRVDDRLCPLPGQTCFNGACVTGRCHDSTSCLPAASRCDPATHVCGPTPPATLPYRVAVTVDPAGKAPLSNPQAWVRLDFTALLASVGQTGKVVEQASIRVYDENVGGFGEVPSKVLRSYATANDVLLWFWARGKQARNAPKTFQVYFTTTDNPGTVASYDIAPPVDAIVAYRQTAIAAFRGDYRGRVTMRQGLPIPPLTGDNNTIALADFDEDGFVDYIACNQDSWDLYFHRNLGGPDSFSDFDAAQVIPGSTPVTYNGCMAALAGDFNEDGHMDAVVERDSRDPTGWVLLVGNGDGTFQRRQLRLVGNAPREMDTADFDGDGHLDLLLALNESPNILMFWGDGTGRFSAAQTVGAFQSANLDYYANAAGNFSATTTTPGTGLDFIVGGAHYGYDDTARRQFKNRGQRRSFLDAGNWPHVSVIGGYTNVHGFLRALDYDHDGFDDLVGFLYADGDGNVGGAYYWGRDPATPWTFRRPIRLGRPTDWMGHAAAVPALGHNLLYTVTAAATATPAPACSGAGCSQCTSASQCATGQACRFGKCGACARNGACGTGLVCIQGACSPCTSRGQCNAGQACVAGTCGACSTDTECGAGSTCSGGVCSTPVSCRSLRSANVNASIPDGAFFINPAGTTQFLAWCDMNTDDGGWTLALNLDTDDSTTRDYEDTAFWNAGPTVGVAGTPFAGDFKGEAFTEMGFSELLFVAHDEGVVLGTASYDLLSSFAGSTLEDLFTQLTNETVTEERRSSTGLVAGLDSGRRTAGDLFIDHPYPVIINSTFSPVDSLNRTRLGADYSDVAGVVNFNGHNFGGWGGRHERGGWSAAYEGAQASGYCDSHGNYGTNGFGFAGNNAFFGGNCGTSKRDVDLAVYVR